MNIINASQWDSGTYNEIGQSNPLRWQNLKLVGPDTYEPVSRWWKCKDFMNEVVTSFHTGRNFSIYSFQVTHSTFFNKEDTCLPLRLKRVAKSFLVNMEVANEHLLNEGFPAVEYGSINDGQVFIRIPLEYLCNTLFMSQVTLFIRLANTEKEYPTLKDMVKDYKNEGDSENFNACLKKPLSQFPTSLSEYLWYYNDAQNCPRNIDASKNIQTSLMHNCGVVSWGWKEEECVA